MATSGRANCSLDRRRSGSRPYPRGVSIDATYPEDIFTEAETSPDALAHLGPLAPLAGSWTGRRGTDVAPKADGPEIEGFDEVFDLQPMDPQTNGPQLFYGLRYHQHVVKSGEVETFHDQVGYLLWEPATGALIMTLAIPRGQIAMAVGQAQPGDRTFTLRASADDPYYAIRSNPFLDRAFRTQSWEITFRIESDDAWSYEEVTMLDVQGQPDLFEHRDDNALVRVAPPTPNPLAV